ncbi:MAG: hypothetical protein K8823_1167 [Cenarchaeum symbiont of Oopsacas minuta]|nr:hypothetical protein [Cenarchaeum symbiont of Oopsacas minuta]
MTKQANLDSCQTEHMADLLRQGSELVNRTNVPMILYRITTDESNESYEETICTLTREYVIEQSVTYGGPVPMSIGEQMVFPISDYPAVLIAKSIDLFERVLEQIKRELV